MSLQFLTNYIKPEIPLIDRRLYPDFILSNIDYLYNNNNNFLHEIHFFTAKPKIFELKNAIDDNIYHVFFYMISRLYYIDNGKSDVVFYYAKSNSYIIEEALNNLPNRFKRLFYKDDSYEYIELPGCKWYFDTIDETWIYEYVKNLYKDIWSIVKKDNKKFIYISRRNASSRKILNEDELIPQIKKMGFSTYVLEEITFIDQIKLFASATFIVAPHGAGLSNIIFSDNPTIIEINSPKLTEGSDGKNHYLDIATKMNYNYYRFINFVKKDNNYIINIESLISILKEKIINI